MAKASVTFRNRLASVKVPTEVGMMLPHTREEKKYWALISSSAGVIEELVYRGFLIFLLSSLIPGLHIYLCILISSILFGLAHTYQGPVGVLKTGAAGLLFALVYVCTGSLLPGILLHFVMDYAAKDTGTDKSIQVAGKHYTFLGGSTMEKKPLGTDIVAQIGLLVNDIEKSSQAYADFLGVEKPKWQRAGTLEEAETEYLGKPSKARAKLAFFDVSPTTQIELIEPDHEPSTWRHDLDQNGEGFHHICLSDTTFVSPLTKHHKP